MKWLLIIALMLPAMVQAQDNLQVSKRPTAGEVDTAKATIKAAQDSPTVLAYGGYAVIDIKLEGKLTSYVVPGSDDCLRTVSIPKGQGYQGWLVAKGETAPKWTVIDSIATHDRLLVTGTSNGTTTLIWMTVSNGEAVVVAAFKFVVGKPAPKPDDPPPPVDPLVNSFRSAMAQDVSTGKGDKKWLIPLAGIYKIASNDSLDSLATMNDLDARLTSDRVAAGIPDPDKQLLNLRRAVQTELYSQLGVTKDSGAMALKPDTRRLAKAAMAKIATALETIAQ